MWTTLNPQRRETQQGKGTVTLEKRVIGKGLKNKGYQGIRRLPSKILFGTSGK